MLSNSHPIQIIIADDHELLRLGFINYLENQPKMKVVAEACNGEQLVRLTGMYKPDIVITDIRMPVMDGIKATRIIRSTYPLTNVIVFSFLISKYQAAALLDAGASGFVSKNAHPSELTHAVMAAMNNQHYFCRFSTELSGCLAIHKALTPAAKERRGLLSPREKEVLILVCEEKTNREIAEILNISIRTVEDFRRNLLLKTQTRGVAGLVHFAIEHGIYHTGSNI